MPQPVICSREWARSRRWHERCSRCGHSHCGGRKRPSARILQRSGYILIMAGRIFCRSSSGHRKAAELFYTGDMIDAKMALALGIVNQVVPAAQLEAAVKTLAQKIAQGPSLPIRAVKKALFASEAKELAQALDYEVREQIRCFMSEDCSEGIRAFFDKRPPKFQGQ